MISENEILNLIALSKVKNVGSVTAKNLISYCGSAEAVLKSKKHQLIRIPGIGEKTADELLSSVTLSLAEKELNFSIKNEVKILSYLDKRFPYRLNRYPDAPIILFYKGNADLNCDKIVSIVGTRAITNYGQNLVDELIMDMKHLDILVCSGLAYGVDSAAHRKCVVEEINTVGVLGHGLDILYPSENKTLANKMITKGGLLTEFGIETRPDRENFPMRNRIVAGICDALVVVETKEEGGSMITAEYAFEYNKDVFAFPGRVNDVFSKGSNKLIKSNKAQLIENGNDLLKAMSWDLNKSKEKSAREKLLFIELTEPEQEVVNILKESSPVHIDVFYNKMNLSPGMIASVLLELEFKGLLNEQPGKRYTLVN